MKKLLFVGAALIAAIASIEYVQSRGYYVAGAGMNPTFAVGATLKLRRHAYSNIGDVKRGDIIVFEWRDKSNGKVSPLVKRVVALPGDAIRMTETSVTINGRLLPHVLISRNKGFVAYRETNGKAVYSVQYRLDLPRTPYLTTVPAGAVFCLGDNRGFSLDSRNIGAVAFPSIIAQVP